VFCTCGELIGDLAVQQKHRQPDVRVKQILITLHNFRCGAAQNPSVKHVSTGWLHQVGTGFITVCLPLSRMTIIHIRYHKLLIKASCKKANANTAFNRPLLPWPDEAGPTLSLNLNKASEIHL
jgi:hypothetical protein